MMAIILVLLGFAGAFVSGLVGVGGAIIMIPVILYIPELLMPGSGFDMRTVAGMSMVQVLAASFSGSLKHKQNKMISRPLVLYMGGGIVIGSFIGGFFSRYVAEDSLKMVFALLAALAAIIMFIPNKDDGDGVKLEELEFNKPLAVMIAGIVGVLAGLVGAGGSFMLVPLMIYVLGIPTRITVGSSLTIVLLSSIAGFLGKLTTAQIPFLFALPLVIGALPGAQLGAKYSNKLSSKNLRVILTMINVVTAIKMWLDIVSVQMIHGIFPI